MDNQQLDELLEKKKSGTLKPAERAQLKNLERKLKSEEKSQVSSQVKTNLFGQIATTKVHPKPIRFLEHEITGLATRRDSLKTNHPEMIIEELGSLREINDTKLIRAAVLLLADVSDEDLIKAIKQVQLNMVRTQ
ncbi:hypothetical protein Sps_04655 [Shewanella psychrophila]|uniref:Uncharacterized protein n=1 Tax=Shewanella psychrophila TaxID=225848 RepID=A0A1S6HVZ5_9GAMM|nr:hypothetical protein [Shewanella psychrophila]AQS39740.1 hypothetical protein Sps_04655 [Shewanella psychrophila]